MSKVTLLDIKQALRDERFRKTLPQALLPDVQKYLQNPACPCNMPIYKRILKECPSQIRDYFPTRELSNPVEETVRLAQNNWRVINCKVASLEEELRKMGPGGKQIAVARWEDEVTVVVNEVSIDAEIVKSKADVSREKWKVIDCATDALEAELRKLGPGRKIISLARFQGQVTTIIHELDVVFSL